MAIGEYLRMIWWLVKLQWRQAKLNFSLVIIYNVLSGFRIVISAYAVAKFIELITKIIYEQPGASPNQIYFWLGLVLVVETFFITTGRYIYYVEQRMGITLGEKLYRHLSLKVYKLDQEQLESKGFSDSLGRVRSGIRDIWRTFFDLVETIPVGLGLLISLTILLLASPIAALVIIVSSIPIIVVLRQINIDAEKTYRKNEHDWRLINSSLNQLFDRRYMSEIRLLRAFKYLLED